MYLFFIDLQTSKPKSNLGKESNQLKAGETQNSPNKNEFLAGRIWTPAAA